jgi:hypothetical protein
VWKYGSRLNSCSAWMTYRYAFNSAIATANRFIKLYTYPVSSRHVLFVYSIVLPIVYVHSVKRSAAICTEYSITGCTHSYTFRAVLQHHSHWAEQQYCHRYYSYTQLRFQSVVTAHQQLLLIAWSILNAVLAMRNVHSVYYNTLLFVAVVQAIVALILHISQS